MKIFAKIVHYLARALAILFAVMLSLFIAEGFDPAFGWQSGVMHAIVAAVAIAMAVLAFKRPKIGGAVYILVGLGFLALFLLTSPMATAGPSQFLQSLTTMNPLVIFTSTIGFLFLLDAWLSKKVTLL
jgi:hypothetical protein